MGVAEGKRLPSLFSTTDETYHANLRRCVNNAFSMSTLMQYEPFVNECTTVFLQQTDRLYVASGKVCDFAEWLQYFAFDVIGQITYSRRHGFIDKAEDVDGMIRYLGKLFSYVAPVSDL
jgi:cytochrome P450